MVARTVVVAPDTVVATPPVVVVARTVVVAPDTVVATPPTVVVAARTVVVAPDTVVTAPPVVVVARTVVVVAPDTVEVVVPTAAAFTWRKPTRLVPEATPALSTRSVTSPYEPAGSAARAVKYHSVADTAVGEPSATTGRLPSSPETAFVVPAVVVSSKARPSTA